MSSEFCLFTFYGENWNWSVIVKIQWCDTQLAHQLMHIHKIVYIKTFKIAKSVPDIVRCTLSGVPFTQYDDMLPQHQINIRCECF